MFLVLENNIFSILGEGLGEENFFTNSFAYLLKSDNQLTLKFLENVLGEEKFENIGFKKEEIKSQNSYWIIKTQIPYWVEKRANPRY